MMMSVAHSSRQCVIAAAHARRVCASPVLCDGVNKPRRGLIVLLLLSFAPYFLPADAQPRWYRDGKSVEQLRDEAYARRLNTFIGGDIDRAFPVEAPDASQ
jgi:hypothetical protein